MKIITIRKISVLALVLVLTLAPISFLAIVEHSQAQDSLMISNDQEWTADRIIEDDIVIDSGATLFIKKGVTLIFNGGSIDVLGTLVMSGTTEKPIKLQRSAENYAYYSITVESDGKLIMRNTDISGAGASIYMMQNNSILNTANAYFKGGIHMKGGSLDAQSCNFHDNIVAIYVNDSSYDKVVVNRTKFVNNEQMDVGFSGFGTEHKVNFRYNWWGDSGGPKKECYGENQCYYEKINEHIDASDWLIKEDFRDPVIIIPGILGSWKWTSDGDWKLDPIFKTYDSLVETFEKNGYTKDKDLFLFPYQWRDSNVNSAKLLREKIAEIRKNKNWPKVDIVAHSMGGLIAREYIESTDYQNDIDQLITIGTPHKGAPEDYLVWDGGKIATSKLDVENILIEKVFKQEAKENGYADIFDFIHKLPMKSIQEILPTYDYLRDVSSNNLRKYSEHYPVNTFLEEINNENNLKKLSNVEFTNIIGKLDENKTINEIKVEKIALDNNALWEHGKPENFDSSFGDHGLSYGKGDGTVPIESTKLTLSLELGERDLADNTIELVATHLDLPSKSANVVYETLTGQIPSKKIFASFMDNVFMIFVFSPIDIQVISPSGKIVGKNFSGKGILNQINGAYYTGYATKNEFITIPNPEDGEYQILTQGIGSGDYRIEATKISEDGKNVATESTAIFLGTATSGSSDIFKANINADKVVNPEQKTEENNNSEIKDKIVLSVEINNSDDSSSSDNSGHKKTKNKKTNRKVAFENLISSSKENVKNSLLLTSAENPYSEKPIENNLGGVAGEASENNETSKTAVKNKMAVGLMIGILFCLMVCFWLRRVLLKG